MTSVAVVGGGVAGLTFAVAGLRAGLDVTVYEKDTAPRGTEAGLQLGPNAVRVLDGLGAGPGLRTVACLPGALEFLHRRTGETLLHVPVRPDYSARFGAEHMTLLRADLRRVLLDLLPDGTVRYGAQCGDITEDADGVRLGFTGDHADVHADVYADLAVGADGTHSWLRGFGKPDREPVPSGRDAYRAVVPAPPNTPETVRSWLGGDSNFLCYPVDSGRSLNLVAVVPATDEPADPLRHFADGPAEVLALLRSAPRFHRSPLSDRDPLPEWNTWRTTLIGDAAHPMLPHQAQGACQAVEDAAALAALLGAEPDISAALRGYRDLRKPRTDQLQRAAREFGDLTHSPAGADLLAVLSPDDLIGLMADTYAYDVVAQALSRKAAA